MTSETLIQIGIGELKLSDGPDDVLVTYSLGSCVGLSLYDPHLRLGGLVHCMLPMSKASPEEAQRNPGKFTDTGVGALLQAMLDRGAKKDRMIAKVAGGACMSTSADLFKIGERNCTVLHKMLWRNDILIAGEDTGGDIPRTMYLYISNGRTTIRSRSQEREL